MVAPILEATKNNVFQKLDQFSEYDSFYHHEDDYDIGFDYYHEEYSFLTIPKNI